MKIIINLKILHENKILKLKCKHRKFKNKQIYIFG